MDTSGYQHSAAERDLLDLLQLAERVWLADHERHGHPDSIRSCLADRCPALRAVVDLIAELT